MIGDVADSAAWQKVDLQLLPALAEAGSFPRRAEPVTFGLPLPQGWLSSDHDLELLDSDQRSLPVQVQALDSWPDRSVRWALLDFQTGEISGGSATYALLRRRRAELPNPAAPRVEVQEAPRQITVNTGVARFCAPTTGRFPFEEIHLQGGAIDVARTGLHVRDGSGAVCRIHVDRVCVEERGPLRAVLYFQARVFACGREPLVELFARTHFFAGSSTVRFAITLRNPRRAAHPGGYWDLGSRGSIYLKDVSFAVALPSEAGSITARCSPEPGAPFEPFHPEFTLYQDSSGGENWRSSNHMNRNREVPNRFRGYRLGQSGEDRHGLRATPIVALTSEAAEIAVGMPQFWQNFPKSIEAAGHRIILRLFPEQYGDLHELQGGEQRTHTFLVAFGRDRVTLDPLAWCRNPLIGRADPGWYCGTRAVPHLLPLRDSPSPEYEALVNSAIDPDHGFVRKREIIDEYGWRNFGDIYGDHEAVSKREPPPLVSHYNNQYDAIVGFVWQFMRSGDLRWWLQMDELARHVVDIDIYHTELDKPAYNGGLFWHTYHYVDADTATHRTYARSQRAGGGGPSAEHNYTTGLMLHYFLTGDDASREAAIGLARWVVRMDDGRRTVFRWLSTAPTGMVSAMGSMQYHGPGRAGGNSVSALLDGFRITGEAELMNKAEAIIRRCIHPADDIADRNLLDVERRWFYTIFLQALGKYMNFKAERGELDTMYAYARASLLHYARWMLDNEQPYLERPEILEYPTESWAAYDMRKSEVFDFAALHATGTVRARFKSRADFYFRYSTSTLLSKQTRTFTRPVVVMLTNGFRHLYFLRNPDASERPPSQGYDFGVPECFVPQKTLALRRVKIAGLLTIALAGALLLAALNSL